jgi:hypothetical protein
MSITKEGINKNETTGIIDIKPEIWESSSATD